MHQKNARNKFNCVLKVVQLVRQYAKIVSGGKKIIKQEVFFSLSTPPGILRTAQVHRYLW